MVKHSKGKFTSLVWKAIRGCLSTMENKMKQTFYKQLSLPFGRFCMNMSEKKRD